ncbi:MAG TPA: 2,3-bisphosphoglycerate-independent phosphoglycerate mutase [Candidatus Dojkabacteria bacterium]
MKNKKVVLLIMDGWGLGPEDKYNAVANADTPNYDALIRDFPDLSLFSDGEFVGLPKGQFGTSEINHQVIGTGRVIFQDLPKIDRAIETKMFFQNEKLLEAVEHVKKNNSALHLAGIISDGKVHSSVEHVKALIELAEKHDLKKVYVHAFTDGRDTPPKSAEKFLREVTNALKNIKESAIATIQGRFWLDRDREWEKTDTALDLMVDGKGNSITDNWEGVMNFAYNRNETDEFFSQYLLNKKGLIKENDSVIFFHYRTDRLYQIVKRLKERRIKNLKMTTFIEVSEEFDKVGVAFPRDEVKHSLAEILSLSGKRQFHITETEKYSHLTYFFNGGRESEYENEKWELIQSNRYVKPFYNFEPNMKVFDITKKVIQRIKKGNDDFILINFANPDMVGHTGNYEAALIACESVDYALGKIFEALKNKLHEYAFLVTADHGNSDQMWDYENNQPHTQHTLNPVPFILVSDYDKRLKKLMGLENIAPTILDLMGLEKPIEMQGESFLE